MAPLKIIDLGLIDYEPSLEFQKETFLQIKNNNHSSALILCQHHPVITLGRNADERNVLASLGELAEKNIPKFEIERGGGTPPTTAPVRSPPIPFLI